MPERITGSHGFVAMYAALTPLAPRPIPLLATLASTPIVFSVIGPRLYGAGLLPFVAAGQTDCMDVYVRRD
jgi:hypothetical protein